VHLVGSEYSRHALADCSIAAIDSQGQSAGDASLDETFKVRSARLLAVLGILYIGYISA